MEETETERAQAVVEHMLVQDEILAAAYFPNDRERAYAVAWATYQYLPRMHPVAQAKYAPNPRAFGLRWQSEVEHARDPVEDAVATAA